ncbi:MAG: toll/interleukin-1 receptor domain-containing protein [Deltaproteobacteria bacterium]|nr:toll/interleukin-1 receptor domain-containing protein [Deltaproteobacteria bacterium]
MTKSVFLIHDVKAKPFARQLAIDLSLAGATVWLDEAEIGGVDSLISKFDEEKLVDVYLAILLTPDSVNSDWLQREVGIAQNQDVSGIRIRLLPLLYSDCAIPAFMAKKLCADFRNPVNYSSMLRRVINRLDLGGDGEATVMPAKLAGLWRGAWNWCGRPRNADMFLSSYQTLPSKMVIRYLKSGILTIVEQILDVRISGNSVKLVGRSYRLLERGIALGWNPDTLNLTFDEAETTLRGTKMDKRGTQSPVLFKRKQP